MVQYHGEVSDYASGELNTPLHGIIWAPPISKFDTLGLGLKLR